MKRDAIPRKAIEPKSSAAEPRTAAFNRSIVLSTLSKRSPKTMRDIA